MTSRNHSRYLCCAFLALLTLGFLNTTPAQAQRRDEFFKTSKGVLSAFRTVVKEPAQSTVEILQGKDQVALGTIVSEDGLILTKASELQEKPVCKLKNGKEYTATVIGIHDPYDLALLKIDAKGLKPIQWVNSKDAPVGSWVATTGIDDLPIAIGVVSVAARKVSARDLPRSTSTKSGYLGVSLEDGDKGVRVTRVMPDTAASKAGLETGDEILSVGGKDVDGVENLVDTIGKHKAGDTITLRVLREEKEMELKATLGKRPSTLSRGDFQNQLGSKLSDRRNGFPSILQHDTVVKPEECGGPLVEIDGKAIGINIARAGRTESYAVPAEAILQVLPQLKAGKLAPGK